MRVDGPGVCLLLFCIDFTGSLLGSVDVLFYVLLLINLTRFYYRHI